MADQQALINALMGNWPAGMAALQQQNAPVPDASGQVPLYNYGPTEMKIPQPGLPQGFGGLSAQDIEALRIKLHGMGLQPMLDKLPPPNENVPMS